MCNFTFRINYSYYLDEPADINDPEPEYDEEEVDEEC